jgi:D-sedoheptulose 7-phosphate isomerase
MKKKSMDYVELLVKRYPALDSIKTNIVSAIEQLAFSTLQGGKYLICGNGGSSADSEHIVGELMKGFILKRTIDETMQLKLQENFSEDADYLIKNLQKGIPSISLTSHNALTSAFSNDNASDLIFAQQVLGYGSKHDVLIAISTSGNSKNILYAAQIAKVIGIKVISLTGKTGGKLKNLSDVLLNAPETETYKIQEYHLPIYHCLCLALENEFYGD